MKQKTEGTYQIAPNATVEVKKIDNQWLEIKQQPICSCDRTRSFLLKKRPAEKLIRYLKNDYHHTIFKLLLECSEVHHHGWNCQKPCWFRVNHPEIMTKVYRKLTAEKAYKIRRGYYSERHGEESAE